MAKTSELNEVLQLEEKYGITMDIEGQAFEKGDTFEVTADGLRKLVAGSAFIGKREGGESAGFMEEKRVPCKCGDGAAVRYGDGDDVEVEPCVMCVLRKYL